MRLFGLEGGPAASLIGRRRCTDPVGGQMRMRCRQPSVREGDGPDAITAVGAASETTPKLSDYPVPLRTYWLNHSMVRVQACSAVTLL